MPSSKQTIKLTRSSSGRGGYYVDDCKWMRNGIQLKLGRTEANLTQYSVHLHANRTSSRAATSLRQGEAAASRCVHKVFAGKMFRERIPGGEAVKGVCVDTRRMRGGRPF